MRRANWLAKLCEAEDVRRRRAPRDPRCDLHRPLFCRSLWPADRKPTRGRREFRQIGGRLPGQYRDRNSATRAQVRPDHARGRRTDGRLHSRTAGSRRRRRRRGSRRQGALDGACAACRGKRGRLTDDFQSLRLRRHGVGRKRHRRGLHCPKPRHRCDRNAFLQTGRRRGAGQGDRAGQEAWRKGGVRRRLPAQPLGARRPRGGFRAVREVRRRVGAPQAGARRLRPDHRHGRGDHDRGGRRQRAGLAQGHSRGLRRFHRAQARRQGLHRL